MSTVVIKRHTLPPHLDDYEINGQPLNAEFLAEVIFLNNLTSSAYI